MDSLFLSVTSCDLLIFQTDSDEDVVFVSEKGVASSREIIFDQTKRLALQRDIDQQSQPKQPTKPLTSLRSVAVEGPGERMTMKVEEDKSEGKIVKKKKQKKEQTSLPEKNKCTVDDGSLAEEKKGKKSKKVKAITLDVEPLNGGVEKEEKKKKKKSKTVKEPLNDADVSDVKSGNDEGIRKEKKKKKKLADDENGVETAESSVKEEEVEQRVKKEKKVKSKSVQAKSEHLKLKKEEVEDELPKKAKKAKKSFLVEGTDTEEKVKDKKKTKTTKDETVKAEEEDVKSVNEKKKKAKTKVAEDVMKVETLETETEELKVKKKKKKSQANEAGTPQIKGKNKTSKVNKDDILNEKSTESQTVIFKEEKVELKKKGKKDRTASVEVKEEEETEPKKKKRKKRAEEEQLEVECEEAETQSVDTSKKRKRKKSAVKEETQDVSVETSVKKKKIKEEVKDEHEVPQTDVVFLSEKSGNTDEVTINQERRQALQMEVDEASQPKKAAKPVGFGQWSTAQFDNSEQQQKFLRLMGGFKKGFQPASGSTGGANMALGKNDQQKLQQGLLGQFERAQSRRMDFNNKGSGLGFSAPSNKKFAIDINASRSVRFDD